MNTGNIATDALTVTEQVLMSTSQNDLGLDFMHMGRIQLSSDNPFYLQHILRNANIAGLAWGTTVAGYGLVTGTPILPGIGTAGGAALGFTFGYTVGFSAYVAAIHGIHFFDLYHELSGIKIPTSL